MTCTVILVISLALLSFSSSTTLWSFQSSVKLPPKYPTGNTYGLSPSILFGRGIMTLVSGYDSNTTGIFVHSTNNIGVDIDGSSNSWSFQTKIFPKDTTTSSLFGRELLYINTTVIASAPNLDNGRFKEVGAIYVFNATTHSSWSQIQKIVPPDPSGEDQFGNKIRLSGTNMMISAAGQNEGVGSVYIYTQVPGSLLWSFHAKLLPFDTSVDQYFGQTIAIRDNIAIVGAKNDDRSGAHSGSVYIFQNVNSNGVNAWSQQQKIIGEDILLFQPDRASGSLGTKFFGSDIALGDNFTMVGVLRTDSPQQNIESVYIFQGVGNTNLWSLNQKLFVYNSTTSQELETDVYYHNVQLYFYENSLYVSLFTSNEYLAPNGSIVFEFVSYNHNPWSLQQKLFYPTYHSNDTLSHNFSITSQWGSYLLLHGDNEVLIYSKFNNQSCLLLDLSDHFGDGWDSAYLTVRAPDTSNNSFQTACFDNDPYRIRYCPSSLSEDGYYIIKIYSPTSARYYWETSWKVTIESQNVSYYGDFSSKVIVNFNSTSLAFEYYTSENLVNISTSAKCFDCAAVSFTSWTALEQLGQSSFFPINAYGASYFISSIDGYRLDFTGKVCMKSPYDTDIKGYECYQTLFDGLYTLRLGKGYTFDVKNEKFLLPKDDAKWIGCGTSGGINEQLIFRVVNQQCIPIHKLVFNNRCSHSNILNKLDRLTDISSAFNIESIDDFNANLPLSDSELQHNHNSHRGHDPHIPHFEHIEF